ncbi:MAG: hypothetical protein PHP64_02860 [Actinomycetota bacterium]|nr:hypothetical protein [Actinomycetota bacterium]
MENRDEAVFRREKREMDIFGRLDRLEDFVANSKHVPLSSSAMINEAEFYDLLDDIRATLPNELKQARAVTRDKERIITEAGRKEEDILARAEKRAEMMVQETEIVKQAELERDHIIEAAEQDARQVRDDAKGYADRIFGEVEASLMEVRESVEELLSLIGSWREKLGGYPVEPEEEEYGYEGENE